MNIYEKFNDMLETTVCKVAALGVALAALSVLCVMVWRSQ